MHRPAHRPWFLAAAGVWCLGALWWATAPGPGPVHGLFFGLGFMPAFIAGFCLQSLPRWLGLPPETQDGRGAAALWGLGWLVLLAAQLSASVEGGTAGLLLAAAALALLVGRLARWLRAAGRASPRFPAKGPAQGLCLALLLVTIALCAAAACWQLQDWLALRWAMALGFWGGVCCGFVLALERLTPLLPVATWQGLPIARTAAVSALVAHGCSIALPVGAALREAAPGAVLAWSLALLQGGAAVLLWRAALRAELVRARRVAFVAQLHRGLLWLALGLSLGGASCLPLSDPLAISLRLAATHALTLGFLCTVMLAMVSRVSAVHAGQAQAADRLQRALHLGLQLLCAARVALALSLPAQLLPWLAGGFAVLALAWTWRYLPLLLHRPKAPASRPSCSPEA